ncbi:protein S100-P-like [Phyllopteryx taeniolatus]|uniref:protein S100-P-like n=1 Tax=Phyllopteryx taeniolatus TaxID=161469 RepID=UPI002AD28AF8|nr:protein S100-P-like [Phyllopteryx taeniolatus]
MCESSPTNLEMAMCCLGDIFDQYAAAEGNSFTLTKKELRTLIEKELPELYQAAQADPEGLNLMQGLDSDKDGEVDFQEFMIAMSCVSCISKASRCFK